MKPPTTIDILCCFLSQALLCHGQIQLFTQDTSFDNQPSAICNKALSTTIDCNSLFTFYPNYDFQGPFSDSKAHDQFCSSTCTASLSSYRATVLKDCSGQPEPYNGIPAEYGVDRLWAYQNRTCLKDPQTGEYCNNLINKWSAQLPDYDHALDEIPKEYLCSDCYLALLQAIQRTPYSNYGVHMVDPYKRAQEICGVKYPTEVQPWPAKATIYRPPGVTAHNQTAKSSCLSGKTVKVQQGDDCHKLSTAHSVSTGTLRTINSIFPDCSNLETGAEVCLPQACSIYKVESGDTCHSIAAISGIRWLNIVAYNPTVNRACSNLVTGENLCLSPPAGHFAATASSTNRPWSISTFANATISLPTGLSGTSQG